MSQPDAVAPGGASAADEGPVLLIKSTHANRIRAVFEVLKEIVHDVNIRVDHTGLKIVTMDGYGCALVYLKLWASGFEEFRCRGAFTLGVNMTSVFKLVKISDNQDIITLYLDAPDSNELGIKIQNAEKNSTTDFKLTLMDVDEKVLVMPDVEFDNVITMPSAYFQRLCRDMSYLSDTMYIRSEGSRLVLGCKGDFARQETVIGEADAGMAISALSDKTIEGRFSLKYLSLFCKASSLAATIELFLKEDFPLILKYNVASMGELRFCVAHKADV